MKENFVDYLRNWQEGWVTPAVMAELVCSKDE
jgi:hypothetical protein